MPDNYEAVYRKGRELRILGRYKKALESLDHAVYLCSDYHEAFYEKSVVLTKIEQYEEALKCCEKALEISKKITYVWKRGAIFYYSSNYQSAIDSYTEAIEQMKSEEHPCLYKVLVSRGMALSGLQRHSEAIDDYKSSIDINSNYCWSHMHLGDALYEFGILVEEQKDYERAILLYQNAIEEYHYGIRINPASTYAICKLQDIDVRLNSLRMGRWAVVISKGFFRKIIGY